jgi:hypothetical protein
MEYIETENMKIHLKMENTLNQSLCPCRVKGPCPVQLLLVQHMLVPLLLLHALLGGALRLLKPRLLGQLSPYHTKLDPPPFFTPCTTFCTFSECSKSENFQYVFTQRSQIDFLPGYRHKFHTPGSNKIV